jgi:hypothetical protein
LNLEKSQKYEVNQYPIETILTWVKSNELAIPEIQRPFVWNSTQVRKLIDSLYNGFPVGYLISWKDPSVKLKDGSKSEGKRILIDGQQRVTGLMTSILKEDVIDSDYRKIRIQIAFNPIEQKFEVFNPAIEKDKSWIPDIAPIVDNTASIRKITDEYVKNNPDADIDHIDSALEKLRQIGKKTLGFIELDSGLDIDTVTEIFVRVNQTGVKLSQADFVMSKLASYGDNNEGSNLRKCIDYFCHLAVAPEFFSSIKENDTDFAKSDYFKKISWLKDEKDDFYDPDYTDVLRVAFTSEFERGKLGDLVSLLSGRNFETREFDPKIKEDSFKKLEKSILNTVNETNFKRFLMILDSAGFISRKFYQSANVVNVAYILYLKLKSEKFDSAKIEKIVKRWFVMSSLTSRYSGSVESSIDADVRNFTSKNIENYLENVEKTRLSEAFWDTELISALSQYNLGSPQLGVFRAARVKNNEKGFLSRGMTVRDLVSQRGDDHHIFPRNYLKRNGKSRKDYNQLANFVYTQQEINIAIGNKAPKEYMGDVKKQCNGKDLVYGGIDNMKLLEKNMSENCIPESIFAGTIENYELFLEQRRELMAQKIKEYYFSL